jgi:hypothetical protein
MLRRFNKRKPLNPTELKASIVEYLEKHPESKDTITGIARWWVSEKPSRVEAVLDELVEEGLVQKKAFSSLVLYSLSSVGKRARRKEES